MQVRLGTREKKEEASACLRAFLSLRHHRHQSYSALDQTAVKQLLRMMLLMLMQVLVQAQAPAQTHAHPASR